jgi:membrane peptidoglycan carboxypeptidase
MQLEKCFERKNAFAQEEILLVTSLKTMWSKERMLEVYFNIIEWGPNVYGIGKQSVYFKTPAGLPLKNAY